MAEQKYNKIKGQGKRKISVKFYEALVEAFRDNPGNFTRVAKAVGTSRPTAKRAWERGWDKFKWAPPIEEVIAAEQEIARARIQDETDAEEAREKLVHPEGGIAEVAEQRRDAHLKAHKDRAKAREHAIQARVEIGKMIEGLVKLVQQGEAMLLRRNPGAQLLADRLNKEMIRMSKATRKDFNIHTAMSILRTHNNEVRSVTMAGRRAFELQQTHLGEPSKILGVQSNFDDADESTLKREIEKALEAMDESPPMTPEEQGQVRH